MDRGFHYIALGANGLPLDYDGDNMDNYVEDADGNGTTDTGETNWQVSENGTSYTPGLQVFTLME